MTEPSALPIAAPAYTPALPQLGPADFEFPTIMLSGAVDYNMYIHFRNMLGQAPQQGLVVIELSTLGGDPEVARMMGEDIRFHSDMHPERRIAFLGKTAIYSAGATFMGFFTRENRYLTRGTRLMIHERIITKTLHIEGPLTTCIASLKATINEIESSIAIQNEGFANLIAGSAISLDEVLRRAPENWYLEAQEALALGLVQAVL
jgi:ATP-dependent protease ClpP protease subunit